MLALRQLVSLQDADAEPLLSTVLRLQVEGAAFYLLDFGGAPVPTTDKVVRRLVRSGNAHRVRVVDAMALAQGIR